MCVSSCTTVCCCCYVVSMTEWVSLTKNTVNTLSWTLNALRAMISNVMGHLLHMQKMKSTFKSDKLKGSSNPTRCVYVIEQQTVAHLLAEISHDSHIYICYPLPCTIELIGKIRNLPKAVNKELDIRAAQSFYKMLSNPFWEHKWHKFNSLHLDTHRWLWCQGTINLNIIILQ